MGTKGLDFTGPLGHYEARASEELLSLNFITPYHELHLDCINKAFMLH